MNVYKKIKKPELACSGPQDLWPFYKVENTVVYPSDQEFRELLAVCESNEPESYDLVLTITEK